MMRFLLAHSSSLLLAAVVALFALASPRFLTLQNCVNILLQASSTMVLAAGMTWVLVTSGVDLSIGSLMFLCAALVGKLVQADVSAAWAVFFALLVGPLCGVAHGLAIVLGAVSPFIVTLASLFMLRGAGLWISRTRAMNLPSSFTEFASKTVLGVPQPVWIAIGMVAVLHWLQTRSVLGRHAYAVGYDAAAARRAGIDVASVLVRVYALSGACGAVAAMLSLGQLGAVSPTFGKEREFEAVAAAVLGGASLFGGRGKVFPGAVIGSLLVTIVFNGLNIMNANPYAYPLLTAGVVLLAVLFDSLRLRADRRTTHQRAVGSGGAL
jgi:ribose transport system permease protein